MHFRILLFSIPLHLVWSNYSDFTRPHPKWWFSKGNPLISGKSRLVKYYNLARSGFRFCHNDRKWSLLFPCVMAMHVPLLSTASPIRVLSKVASESYRSKRMKMHQTTVLQWLKDHPSPDHGFIFPSFCLPLPVFHRSSRFGLSAERSGRFRVREQIKVGWMDIQASKYSISEDI